MDDLERLLDQGYDVDLQGGYLVVRQVPYVTSAKAVERGLLIMPAAMAGDQLTTPPDHTTHFAGSEPCDAHGQPLTKVINGQNPQELMPGLRTDYYFSAKPAAGNYGSYFEKVTTYVELLSRWARQINPHATAQTYPTREVGELEDYPFEYRDSASSRAGVTALSSRFGGMKIAIVGMGGTGSHILDLVAKVPVAEIHLFDGDVFVNHNAFRAPGAAHLKDLQEQPNKAEYWASRYAHIKRGITPHPTYFEPATVTDLTGFDFVFLALDDGSDRAGIAAALEKAHLSFIDVGMGVTNAGSGLTGMLRVSTSTPSSRADIPTGGTALDEYGQNIQIGDLNALNAALAVVQWKRHLGFYADMTSPTSTFVYPISDNVITGVTE